MILLARNDFMQAKNQKVIKELERETNLNPKSYNVYLKIDKKGGKGSVNKPKIELTKEEIDSVIDYGDLIKNMTHAIDHLKKEYNENLNLRIMPSEFLNLFHDFVW